MELVPVFPWADLVIGLVSVVALGAGIRIAREFLRV